MISVIDANVILRFLLRDHGELSPASKRIFDEAQEGKSPLYLDEVIVAEVVWVLESFYKMPRGEIADKIEHICGQDWVVNPRKSLIAAALIEYKGSSFSYIDCWIHMVAQSLGYPLVSFDKKLMALERKRKKR